jgi:effector-binding domain-containing protein
MLKEENGFEIRQYDPYVIMKVKGESNRGFGVLFDYISGSNAKNQKIKMTVPVLTDVEASDYIAFTMPKAVSGDAPSPSNPNVQIVPIPAKTYLATRFKGSMRHAGRAVEALKEYAKTKALRLIGEPLLLRYQGPFMPNFLKDNDVMIEIEP